MYQKEEYENDNSSSSSETIGQGSPNYENLLYENKMKSQALKKASNIIDILRVELEVVKSAREEEIFEAVEKAEEEMKALYKVELEQLRDKVHLLERELEKQNSARRQSDFTKTKEFFPRKNSAVIRNSSVSSLHKSRSRQKKIPRNCSSATKKKNYDLETQGSSFEKQLYREMILHYHERQDYLLTVLADTIQLEKEELSILFSNKENMIEETQLIFKSFKDRPEKIILKEMRGVIEQQEGVIRQLKIYQSQLEQMIQGLESKLSMLFLEQSEKNSSFFTYPSLITPASSPQIKKILQVIKSHIEIRQNSLASQNFELRNILDEMINLIKQNRQYVRSNNS